MINTTIDQIKFFDGITPPSINEVPINCMVRENAFSTDCLYKTLCPQFNKYFIKMGIIIISSYIVIMFLKWWFFKYGYKLLRTNYFNDIDKRLYWDIFINARLGKLMLGYIMIVVWLSINN